MIVNITQWRKIRCQDRDSHVKSSSKKVGFEELRVSTVTDVFGERVSEGGSSGGEGSVSPGPEIGSKWQRQEVGIRGAKAVGRN